MTMTQQWVRRGAGAVMLLALASMGACRSRSEIVEALGTVLGGGQGQGAQVGGTIAGLDTRNLQIGLRQSNGQTVGIGYDENTQVVYQGQRYQVTNLEAGDEVVMRVLDRGNGNYYTDSVHVTASVSSNGATGSAGGGNASNAVRQLQGVVRQIDRTNGLFSLEMQGGATVIVAMPYNPRTNDVQRFQSLRAGESVRLSGVFLNNTRVELRQFH